MSHSELLQRITARPDVFGGKPIIRNMRLSVELILSLMAQGVTPEGILDEYPELEPDDIRACVAYAHAVIARDTPSAISVAEPWSSTWIAVPARRWPTGCAPRGMTSSTPASSDPIRSIRHCSNEPLPKPGPGYHRH